MSPATRESRSEVPVPPQVPSHRTSVAQTSSRQHAAVPAARRGLDHRRLDLHDPPNLLTQAQAEVHVLRPVEVPLVQATDCIERTAAENLARADCEVDVPHTV